MLQTHTAMANANSRKNIGLESLSELKKLKAQQTIIEKNTTCLLNNLNNIFQHDDLKLFLLAMKKQTQAEKSKFRNDIQEIQNSLITLGKNSCVLDLDLEHLRDFLFTITDNITSVKDANQENIDKLTEQEKTATAELESLERRIDDFVKVNLNNVNVRKPLVRLKPTSLHFEQLIPNKLNREADEFDRFLLRTGGHTGGWDEDDHLLFVRQRGKHPRHRLADALNAVLPDIPVEVILQHISWFSEYELLKNQQRNAIKTWRDAQKRVAATNVTTQQNPAKPRLCVNPRVAEHKRQQILEWKTRRQEQQLCERESRKPKEPASQTRSAQDRERLAEYRLAKQTRRAEVAERERREESRQHRADGKLLAMFRERDRAVVADNLRRADEERRARERRAMVTHVNKVQAERDPERLLRHTEGWRNRVKLPAESSEAMRGPLHLECLPKLKIPTWRKTAV